MFEKYYKSVVQREECMDILETDSELEFYLHNL